MVIPEPLRRPLQQQKEVPPLLLGWDLQAEPGVTLLTVSWTNSE